MTPVETHSSLSSSKDPKRSGRARTSELAWAGMSISGTRTIPRASAKRTRRAMSAGV